MKQQLFFNWLDLEINSLLPQFSLFEINNEVSKIASFDLRN